MSFCHECNAPLDNARACRCAASTAAPSNHATAVIGASWEETRLRILNRDRYTCRMCARSLPEDQLRVEHIAPLRNFRSLRNRENASSDRNLRTLCVACYAWKSHQQARF